MDGRAASSIIQIRKLIEDNDYLKNIIQIKLDNLTFEQASLLLLNLDRLNQSLAHSSNDDKNNLTKQYGIYPLTRIADIENFILQIELALPDGINWSAPEMLTEEEKKEIEVTTPPSNETEAPIIFIKPEIPVQLQTPSTVIDKKSEHLEPSIPQQPQLSLEAFTPVLDGEAKKAKLIKVPMDLKFLTLQYKFYDPLGGNSLEPREYSSDDLEKFRIRLKHLETIVDDDKHEDYLEAKRYQNDFVRGQITYNGEKIFTASLVAYLLDNNESKLIYDKDLTDEERKNRSETREKEIEFIKNTGLTKHKVLSILLLKYRDQNDNFSQSGIFAGTGALPTILGNVDYKADEPKLNFDIIQEDPTKPLYFSASRDTLIANTKSAEKKEDKLLIKTRDTFIITESGTSALKCSYDDTTSYSYLPFQVWNELLIQAKKVLESYKTLNISELKTLVTEIYDFKLNNESKVRGEELQLISMNNFLRKDLPNATSVVSMIPFLQDEKFRNEFMRWHLKLPEEIRETINNIILEAHPEIFAQYIMEAKILMEDREFLQSRLNFQRASLNIGTEQKLFRVASDLLTTPSYMNSRRPKRFKLKCEAFNLLYEISYFIPNQELEAKVQQKEDLQKSLEDKTIPWNKKIDIRKQSNQLSYELPWLSTLQTLKVIIEHDTQNLLQDSRITDNKEIGSHIELLNDTKDLVKNIKKYIEAKDSIAANRELQNFIVKHHKPNILELLNQDSIQPPQDATFLILEQQSRNIKNAIDKLDIYANDAKAISEKLLDELKTLYQEIIKTKNDVFINGQLPEIFKLHRILNDKVQTIPSPSTSVVQERKIHVLEEEKALQEIPINFHLIMTHLKNSGISDSMGFKESEIYSDEFLEKQFAHFKKLAEISEADVFYTSVIPSKDNLEEFKTQTNTSFIRVNDDNENRLFYVNNKTKEIIEIELKKEDLSKFDNHIMNAEKISTNQYFLTSAKELHDISIILPDHERFNPKKLRKEAWENAKDMHRQAFEITYFDKETKQNKKIKTNGFMLTAALGSVPSTIFNSTLISREEVLKEKKSIEVAGIPKELIFIAYLMRNYASETFSQGGFLAPSLLLGSYLTPLQLNRNPETIALTIKENGEILIGPNYKSTLDNQFEIEYKLLFQIRKNSDNKETSYSVQFDDKNSMLSSTQEVQEDLLSFSEEKLKTYLRMDPKNIYKTIELDLMEKSFSESFYVLIPGLQEADFRKRFISWQSSLPMELADRIDVIIKEAYPKIFEQFIQDKINPQLKIITNELLINLQNSNYNDKLDAKISLIEQEVSGLTQKIKESSELKLQSEDAKDAKFEDLLNHSTKEITFRKLREKKKEEIEALKSAKSNGLTRAKIAYELKHLSGAFVLEDEKTIDSFKELMKIVNQLVLNPHLESNATKLRQWKLSNIKNESFKKLINFYSIAEELVPIEQTYKILEKFIPEYSKFKTHHTNLNFSNIILDLVPSEHSVILIKNANAIAELKKFTDHSSIQNLYDNSVKYLTKLAAPDLDNLDAAVTDISSQIYNIISILNAATAKDLKKANEKLPKKEFDFLDFPNELSEFLHAIKTILPNDYKLAPSASFPKSKSDEVKFAIVEDDRKKENADILVAKLIKELQNNTSQLTASEILQEFKLTSQQQSIKTNIEMSETDKIELAYSEKYHLLSQQFEYDRRALVVDSKYTENLVHLSRNYLLQIQELKNFKNEELKHVSENADRTAVFEVLNQYIYEIRRLRNEIRNDLKLIMPTDDDKYAFQNNKNHDAIYSKIMSTLSKLPADSIHQKVSEYEIFKLNRFFEINTQLKRKLDDFKEDKYDTFNIDYLQTELTRISNNYPGSTELKSLTETMDSLKNLLSEKIAQETLGLNNMVTTLPENLTIANLKNFQAKVNSLKAKKFTPTNEMHFDANKYLTWAQRQIDEIQKKEREEKEEQDRVAAKKAEQEAKAIAEFDRDDSIVDSENEDISPNELYQDVINEEIEQRDSKEERVKLTQAIVSRMESIKHTGPKKKTQDALRQKFLDVGVGSFLQDGNIPEANLIYIIYEKYNSLNLKDKKERFYFKEFIESKLGSVSEITAKTLKTIIYSPPFVSKLAAKKTNLKAKLADLIKAREGTSEERILRNIYDKLGFYSPHEFNIILQYITENADQISFKSKSLINKITDFLKKEATLLVPIKTHNHSDLKHISNIDEKYNPKQPKPYEQKTSPLKPASLLKESDYRDFRHYLKGIFVGMGISAGLGFAIGVGVGTFLGAALTLPFGGAGAPIGTAAGAIIGTVIGAVVGFFAGLIDARWFTKPTGYYNALQEAKVSEAKPKPRNELEPKSQNELKHGSTNVVNQMPRSTRQQPAAPNPQLSSPAQPGTLPAQQPETPPIVTPPTSTETPIPRKISGSRG